MARRVAAVTGAAQGLGAEIAVRLANDGFDVALIDIKDDGLKRTCVDVEAAGARAVTLTVDLTAEDAVVAAFARIDDEFGRLDALVNVAGGSGTDPVRNLGELSADIWRRVLDNNLTTAFLCAREAIALMERNGFGRIVNFSSAVANGKFGASGTVGARLPYAASKAALNGFTRQLAKDLARTGITVNSVAPGLILPAVGRVRDVFEAQSQQAQQATLDSLPAGRTGTGTEVAAAVSYLVSDDAGFTTGAVLTVDGAEV